MDYKKLLTNTIQSISIELRTETGDLVPFSGTGKILLTLQFKKFSSSKGFILRKLSISLPHFSGHYRQRGSGFGALTAGIGRFVLPLERQFILPTAKRIGKELLKQGVSELLDVVSSKKSPKQALKNTISKTVKSRLVDHEKEHYDKELIQKVNSSNQTEKHHFHSEALKRSRSDFFAKVNDDR